MPPPTHKPGQTLPNPSQAFAPRRDAILLRLLRDHPATADMLVGLRLFPTRNKALRRLRKLAARGHFRLVGTISRKEGRPEHVYCRWTPKADNLLHEVLLTQLCLRLDAERIVRGYDTDPRIRPDAELWINRQHFFLELDRGTMGYGDIEAKRFAVYAETEDLVLWICSTASRLEGLRKRASRLRSTALFTTLEQALVSPHRDIWIDAEGGKVALPRVTRKGDGKGV